MSILKSMPWNSRLGLLFGVFFWGELQKSCFVVKPKACHVILLNIKCFFHREKNGEHLYTCAIRPPAIYGPGEDRHFPRTVKAAQLGLLLFKVGDPTTKTDWLYVDNLVLALVLASMGLLDDIPGREGKPVAAGQSYFISDGNVHTFCIEVGI